MKRNLTITLLFLIGSIGINCYFKLIAFNIPNKEVGEFRMLAYNIHSLAEEFDKNAISFADLIIQEDPDFVYLTEFYEGRGNVLDTMLRAHYPYSYTKHRWGYNEGDVFYSNWKIDSVLRFYLHGKERIMAYKVCLSHEKDTVSCYCLHLNTNNSGALSFKTILEGKKKRQQEVEVILKSVIKEPYPIIIVGDMNDINGSFSLNMIEDEGFKDAWWEGGLGYGCTYRGYNWPTCLFKLRIDHIMYDSKWKLCDIKVVHSNLSDHNALVGSFNLNRKE